MSFLSVHVGKPFVILGFDLANCFLAMTLLLIHFVKEKKKCANYHCCFESDFVHFMWILNIYFRFWIMFFLIQFPDKKLLYVGNFVLIKFSNNCLYVWYVSEWKTVEFSNFLLQCLKILEKVIRELNVSNLIQNYL